MLGIIAGSGLYEIKGLSVIESIDVDTPFGGPSGPILECEYEGETLYFLPRHGTSHSLPPHRVNYRANVWALKKLGVRRIISISAVGGIKRTMPPGSIVIGDQIIDFTKKRENTFFDGEDVAHVDFTNPYCDDMRKVIVEVSAETGIEAIDGGTYVAVEGPRLETAAEIAFFSAIGVDIVGMTAMPEAALAREAELCYAGMYVVTNYAAGISEGRLTADEVVRTMKQCHEKLKTLLSKLVRSFGAERACACAEALKDARL